MGKEYTPHLETNAENPQNLLNNAHPDTSVPRDAHPHNFQRLRVAVPRVPGFSISEKFSGGSNVASGSGGVRRTGSVGNPSNELDPSLGDAASPPRALEPHKFRVLNAEELQRLRSKFIELDSNQKGYVYRHELSAGLRVDKELRALLMTEGELADVPGKLPGTTGEPARGLGYQSLCEAVFFACGAERTLTVDALGACLATV